MSDNLQELKAIIESGQFHHATYRNFGTLWEGLWIYGKKPAEPLSNSGPGFLPVLSFMKDDPDLKAAEDMCRGTGISVGFYGNG